MITTCRRHFIQIYPFEYAFYKELFISVLATLHSIARTAKVITETLI